MDIKELGKQAGIWTNDGMCVTVTLEIAVKFAELIAAEERESCANLCDAMYTFGDKNDADDCAVAIRMRSNGKVRG